MKGKVKLLIHYTEVTDMNDPALAVFSKLNEVQLKRCFEPAPGLFIAESPKVIRRALDAGYEPVALLMEPKYLEGDDADIAKRCSLYSSCPTADSGIAATSGTAEFTDVAADPDATAGYSSDSPGTAVTADSDIPIYIASSTVLSKITGYHLTNGMLCAMRRNALLPAEEVLVQIAKTKAALNTKASFITESLNNPKASSVPSAPNSNYVRIAILEDIENPTNIGAIFRSAAALGIDAVLLTGGCSDPLYRRAARVSVGNVFQIPWTWINRELISSHQPSLDRHFTAPDNLRKQEMPAQEPSGSTGYIDFLHAMGFKTAALALTDKTISIDAPALKNEEKLAILLGNEGNGLLPETISKSDYVVKIPMPDGVDSLNVAAASAVAFWELRG